jgi:uncharacterized protein with GYD domain
MATYISLINFTQVSFTTIQAAAERIDSQKETLKALGAELKAIYLTMGRYDIIAIFEAPNDETAARAALVSASDGSVKTQTFRAFTEDEWGALIAALSDLHL